MVKKIIYASISCLFVCFYSKAQQESQNDFTQLDYISLYKKIIEHVKDSSVAVKYAEAYFKKAQQINDTSNIGRGYIYRKSLDPNNHRVDLYDSVIVLTKNYKKDYSIITTAYHDKGSFYHNRFQYNEALSNYIEAARYSKKDNGSILTDRIDLNIAKIRIIIGEHQKAIHILNKLWKDTSNIKRNTYKYNSTLISLVDAHRQLNHIDSAKIYINLGIKKNRNNGAYYNYFFLLQGINQLNYMYSNDVFLKIKQGIDSMIAINHKTNASIAYYYLGKAHLKHNNPEEAIKSFHKVDSLFDNSASILPETIDSYKYLKNHYNKIGDLKNEKKYMQKFITFDSVLDINYNKINTAIKDKYEIPFLIEEYEERIETLQVKNKDSKILLNIFYLICISSSLVLIYLLFQKNKYRQRFKQLQENTHSKEIKRKNIASEKPDIPENIFSKVEKCLIQFEHNKQFLEPTINSEKLAHQIGTNRVYFAKAFNYLKNESFNIYLRNIRLDNALDRLKNDRVFRKYTIKTIAHESGFSNAESFSKYFYGKYKIYPSYFIKKMNK